MPKGWYRARVVEYKRETDIATLEFDVERGEHYEYEVGKEVKAKKLKLAKYTQRKMDEYEHFFEIGTTVEINWTKDDGVEANLSPGEWNVFRIVCTDSDCSKLNVFTDGKLIHTKAYAWRVYAWHW